MGIADMRWLGWVLSVEIQLLGASGRDDRSRRRRADVKTRGRGHLPVDAKTGAVVGDYQRRCRHADMRWLGRGHDPEDTPSWCAGRRSPQANGALPM